MKYSKRCAKCGIEKLPDAFYKHERNRDGLQSYCKTCKQKLMRVWREKNSDHMKKQHQHYRETHREERREYNRQWRQKNRGYWRGYQNRRLHEDLNYRLQNYISRAIRRAIKKNRKSAFNILGYTVEELRQHLESLFQPGMSWENYGTEWHIDHITPKSWFNVEGPDGVDEYELRLCWAIENLQPMWGDENLEKNNKYISETTLGRVRITYDQFREIVGNWKRTGLSLIPALYSPGEMQVMMADEKADRSGYDRVNDAYRRPE